MVTDTDEGKWSALHKKWLPFDFHNTIYLILGAVIYLKHWDRDAGRPPWEVSLQKQHQQINDTLDGA